MEKLSSLNMEKRKKRRKAFTVAEKKTLIFLVLKYKDVIESKNNNAITIREKNRQWKIIEKEFKTMGGNRFKTVQRLKKAWNNLKLGVKSIQSGKMQFKVTKMGLFQAASQTDKLETTRRMKYVQNSDSKPGSLGNTSWHRPHPIHTTEDTTIIEGHLPINPLDIKVEPLVNINPQPTLSSTPKKHSSACLGRTRSLKEEAKARVERVQQLLKMDRELHEALLQQENEIHKQKMQNLMNRMSRDNEIHRRQMLHLKGEDRHS